MPLKSQPLRQKSLPPLRRNQQHLLHQPKSQPLLRKLLLQRKKCLLKKNLPLKRLPSQLRMTTCLAMPLPKNPPP